LSEGGILQGERRRCIRLSARQWRSPPLASVLLKFPRHQRVSRQKDQEVFACGRSGGRHGSAILTIPIDRLRRHAHPDLRAGSGIQPIHVAAARADEHGVVDHDRRCHELPIAGEGPRLHEIAQARRRKRSGIERDHGRARDRWRACRRDLTLLIADRGFYGFGGYSGDREMKKLAEETGGRVINVGNKFDKLKEAFDQIALELRSQYNVGYTPTNSARDGTFRKVDIRAKKDYKIQARTGYYALGRRQ